MLKLVELVVGDDVVELGLRDDVVVVVEGGSAELQGVVQNGVEHIDITKIK